MGSKSNERPTTYRINTPVEDFTGHAFHVHFASGKGHTTEPAAALECVYAGYACADDATGRKIDAAELAAAVKAKQDDAATPDKR